jgi:hypothetical protein
MAALREGTDIVYLVSHGVLLNGVEPWLFLQNEAGEVARVQGSSLAERIAELRHAPRLIVMASCESAGRENAAAQEAAAAAHSAIAPRLAEAGVPAVVAMRGQISMETVKLAMPVFFRELTKDGQIDRAMAVARGAVRHRPDSWMPALYLRLKSGRIWYEPGFGGNEKEEFQKWAAICNWVRKRQFLPILGPELGEDLFGGTRELASRLAEKHGFPMAEHDRTDLAKVAQYIATFQDRNFAQDAVQNQFLLQLSERIGGNGGQKSLPELLDLALARSRANPDHPYSMLAELPASIYVNASGEPMLFRALKAVGKNPEAIFGSWRKLGAEVPREPQPKNETPSPETPWVYHVFGLFGKRDSLVITEDDFFDYLIATSTDKLMPRKIRGSLLQNSLLFLGFRLDDWRFRILFRMIMTMQGAETLSDYSHVGVQVNPDEHQLSDVKRAMSYMTSYFQEGKAGSPRISIFWGSAEDFLKELRNRLAGTEPAELAAVAQGGDDDWI